MFTVKCKIIICIYVSVTEMSLLLVNVNKERELGYIFYLLTHLFTQSKGFAVHLIPLTNLDGNK